MYEVKFVVLFVSVNRFKVRSRMIGDDQIKMSKLIRHVNGYLGKAVRKRIEQKQCDSGKHEGLYTGAEAI